MVCLIQFLFPSPHKLLFLLEPFHHGQPSKSFSQSLFWHFVRDDMRACCFHFLSCSVSLFRGFLQVHTFGLVQWIFFAYLLNFENTSDWLKSGFCRFRHEQASKSISSLILTFCSRRSARCCFHEVFHLFEDTISSRREHFWIWTFP